MGRMATRALAKAAIAGLAAIASASGMAQAPGRIDGPLPPTASTGVGPQFRANRPIQLAPPADGPTRDAPLSFGRGRTADRAEPRGAAVASPPSPAPQGVAIRGDSRAVDPVAAAGAGPAASKASAAAPTPAAGAKESVAAAGTAVAPAGASADPVVEPKAAALAANPSPAGAGRADEAKALARLRERLEETLARHATVDARVSVDRNALRVVSQGAAEASARPMPASAGANAMVRRRPAAAPGKRSTGRSTEHTAGPRDWSYSGDTGPAHWATLNPEWAACGAKVPQSPIDIRDGIAVGLPAIEFDLPPAILTIRDDGRAIRAVVREGPAIGVLGRRFELREISFHQPAEFRVDGKAFDLSAHLLHRDEQGRPAIVVVLFELGDESSPRNPVVQTVLDYLPLAQDMLMPVADRTDLGPLLPADHGYYNFVGSLSSPPCTEGVVWMVMREPLRVPPSQVAIFARVHPMNVRPLQPLAGRLIKQSE